MKSMDGVSFTTPLRDRYFSIGRANSKGPDPRIFVSLDVLGTTLSKSVPLARLIASVDRKFANTCFISSLSVSGHELGSDEDCHDIDETPRVITIMYHFSTVISNRNIG